MMKINSHPSAVPHTNIKSIEVPYNASLIIVCSGKKFSTQDIYFFAFMKLVVGYGMYNTVINIVQSYLYHTVP